MVYFVQAVNGGPIKIGQTNNMQTRLIGLQTASPYKLCVLGIDKSADEAIIHKRFESFKLEGEWFTDCPEIQKYIENNTQKFIPKPIRSRKSSEAKVSFLIDGLSWSYSCENPDIQFNSCLEKFRGNDYSTLIAVTHAVYHIGPFVKFLSLDLGDSYVANSIHSQTFYQWQILGWKYKNGKPVANVDAWQGLMEALRHVSVGICCPECRHAFYKGRNYFK